MNNKTLLLVFSVLIILYLGSRILGGKKDRSFDPEIVSIDTAQVDRIVFHPKADELKAVSLKKGAEGWTITKDNITAAAQPNSVQAMLSGIALVKASRIVSKSKDKWKEYELDAETGNRVQIYKGESLLGEFVVGRFTFNQQTRSGISYVRKIDSDNVYAIDGFLSASMGQGFNNFRDKTFVTLTAADLTRVDFSGANALTISKNASNQWATAGTPLDSTKVATYLNGLQSMNGSDFVDGVDLNMLGAPIQSVAISGNNMAAPIKVDCYANSGGAKPFVLRSNLNTALFSSDSTGLYQKLFKKLEDFQ